MPLARRNLLQDRTRFLLSGMGVALSIMLIVVLNGFLSGVEQQARTYLDNVPGTVVVAGAGVDNFFGQSTLLPGGAYERTRQVEGVANVIPVLSQVFIVELRGTKLALFAIGYDADQGGGGGPWRLAQGRMPQAQNEIVLDHALASQREIRPGDTLVIGSRNFIVSGLSAGTSTWAGAFLFMPKAALEGLVLAPGADSYLFVTPSPGVSPEELRDRLVSQTGLSARLKNDLAASDVRLLKGIYGSPLQLMIGIAFLVGTLVVGLVIFTATVERQREYGVLKAMGARNWLLYRVVLTQALITAGAGLVAGVIFSLGLAWLIMARFPAITVALEPGGIILALSAGLAMAVLSALFPARAVGKLAPAEVFRR